MIATTQCRTTVGLLEDQACIGGFEIVRRFRACFLRRQRQHLLILRRMRQIVAHQVLEEAADGRKTIIAADCAVGALGFQMGQERFDCLNIQVGERQVGHRTFSAVSQEAEQQTQCVAIGAHRVRTRPAHALQVIAEERFDQRQQLVLCRRAHRMLRAECRRLAKR
jgi:hypothetical protein